ncbi:hypothetical protein LCGC14_2894920 [marine sediment metagenome]|uniref:Uncharacterized protein n=1 Tax=marine sediment metagenome TaxID=412755 RepID=A0A0F9A3Y4_9ZZZZ
MCKYLKNKIRKKLKELNKNSHMNREEIETLKWVLKEVKDSAKI